MSTVYNRRRGAKADASRTPRQCAHEDPRPASDPVRGLCIRLAPRNRHCDDHQTVPHVERLEGRASELLRLAHQANQSAEAARIRWQTHIKQPAWVKARRRRLKRLALAAAAGLLNPKAPKKGLRRLNPWAK